MFLVYIEQYKQRLCITIASEDYSRTRHTTEKVCMQLAKTVDPSVFALS